MIDLPFDPIQLMREHPEKMRVPGGLLTKRGPQDYVGSVPAITGTLFFKDAHLPEVREAVCACFDVPEDELMAYKARLLDEPKLTKTTTLPDRL
ncbi:hypothetical protein [Achromobacter aloeverae]